MEIIYPVGGDSFLLDNQTFGEWLREREKTSNDEPLYYINSSCWSIRKAAHEIPAARTKVFVNIPTTTTAYTFRYSADNTLYQMIEAVRSGATYEQSRNMLSNNPSYKNKIADVYLLPDEQEYKKQLINDDVAPIDVQIKLRREMTPGRMEAYSIEQFGH